MLLYCANDPLLPCTPCALSSSRKVFFGHLGLTCAYVLYNLIRLFLIERAFVFAGPGPLVSRGTAAPVPAVMAHLSPAPAVLRPAALDVRVARDATAIYWQLGVSTRSRPLFFSLLVMPGLESMDVSGTGSLRSQQRFPWIVG